MDTIFTIDISATDAHVLAAVMYSHMSEFFSGTLDPRLPHAVLISASIVASLAVWLGIVLEAERFWSIPTMCVTFGVAIEAVCTILLFGFDEGISSAQRSTISTQRGEIITLERRLAARTLTDAQVNAIAKRLSQFKGQDFDIVTYWQNPESLSLSNRIYPALVGAGWKYDKPTNGEFLIGVQTGVIIWHDDRAPVGTILAATELVAALKANDIDAAPDATPQSHGNEPMTTKIVVNVGIKP